MGKGKKVTKKVVGSANGRAARGEEADAATKEFAAAGMGLQEPTAAAAEGSGGGGMAPGDAGPPALSTLDDAVPLPAEADPSSGGGVLGGVSRLRPCSPSNSEVLRPERPSRSWMQVRGGWPRATRRSLRRRCRAGALGQRERAGRRGQVSVWGLGCSIRV